MGALRYLKNKEAQKMESTSTAPTTPGRAPTPESSRSGLWRELGVVAVALACILVLVNQNFELKRQNAQGNVEKVMLANTYRLNIELAKLAGNPLPESFLGNVPLVSTPEDTQGYVFIAYNPTACNSCIVDGLARLSEQADQLRSQGLQPHALIGLVSHAGEIAALERWTSHLIDFPFTYVDAAQLGAHLPFEFAGRYTDTPIYLYTDNGMMVLSTFKPVRSQLDSLDLWLSNLMS